MIEPGRKWVLGPDVQDEKNFTAIVGSYELPSDFPSTPTASVYVYRLGEGEKCIQQPNNEDVFYDVLDGNSTNRSTVLLGLWIRGWEFGMRMSYARTITAS